MILKTFKEAVASLPSPPSAGLIHLSDYISVETGDASKQYEGLRFLEKNGRYFLQFYSRNKG